MIYRYAYRIARVDLTRRESETYQVEDAVFERCLGGKALGFYLAMRRWLHDVEPLGPKNRVFVLTGPGSGLLAGGGGTTLVTKSPATQTLTDSIVQGHLGLSIKRAGIDGIEIVGRSEELVYLSIADGDIQFHDASALHGMTCTDTSLLIKEQHPEIYDATVMSIGLAGENQVYYAATIVDGRAFGRGGSGAVLGAKKLKAIIIGGEHPVYVCDKGVIQALNEDVQAVADSGEHGYRQHQTVGTGFMYEKHIRQGVMSGLNYTDFPYQDEQSIKLADRVIAKLEVDKSACFNCAVVCSRQTSVERSPGSSRKSYGPEFETIWAFGAQCGNLNEDIVVEADHLCDEYGLDTISTGNVLGFLFACVARQIAEYDATPADIPELIAAIAHRSGVGNMLANGVMLAARSFGPGAEQEAMHVKGLELPAYDPRGFIGIALALAVSARGGCHRKSFCPQEAKGELDGGDVVGKPQLIIEEEHKAAIRDSLVVCKWAAFGKQNPYYSEAVSAVVGRPYDFDELILVGERSINLARIFNLRAGLTAADDRLPERFFTDKKGAGPLAGARVDREMFEHAKRTYYKLRGWDDQGTPRRDLLEKLDLGEFVAVEA